MYLGFEADPSANITVRIRGPNVSSLNLTLLFSPGLLSYCGMLPIKGEFPYKIFDL